MKPHQYAVAFLLSLLSIGSTAKEEKCYVDEDGKKVCEKCGKNNECGGNKMPAPPHASNRKDFASKKEEKRRHSSLSDADLRSSETVGGKSQGKERISDFKPHGQR